EELANVLDSAPKKNFKESGSADDHKVIEEIKQRYSYLWYIFNEVPNYERWNYCLHNFDQDSVKAIGSDYRNIDPSLVTFEKDIFHNFQRVMSVTSNSWAGQYRPPYMS